MGSSRGADTATFGQRGEEEVRQGRWRKIRVRKRDIRGKHEANLEEETWMDEKKWKLVSVSKVTSTSTLLPFPPLLPFSSSFSFFPPLHALLLGMCAASRSSMTGWGGGVDDTYMLMPLLWSQSSKKRGWKHARTSNINGGCATLIGLTQGCQHAKMYCPLCPPEPLQSVILRGERGHVIVRCIHLL